jgi:hypothetical protein
MAWLVARQEWLRGKGWLRGKSGCGTGLVVWENRLRGKGGCMTL